MADLAFYRRRINQLKAERQVAATTAEREDLELKAIQGRIGDTEEAQRIIQCIAQAIQQRVHRQIAKVVTRCLTAVFEDPYTFSIRFDRKRGKTEAQLVFERDGVQLEDPLNEIGGGVVDVAALALRLSSILLSRPPMRRFLALDEPFKSIRGKENRARTRLMLQRLAEDLKLQILINTDIPEFQLGTVVELG